MVIVHQQAESKIGNFTEVSFFQYILQSVVSCRDRELISTGRPVTILSMSATSEAIDRIARSVTTN